MRKTIVTFCLTALSVIAMAQYRNPILPGFHPDPSICRVDSDFYLVNSSFQYFPGVPVFHSRDLVNWKQIGSVLNRDSQLPLKNATSWTGIYAPTIRYHKGTYYMVTTNVGNGGNFMVTARNPKGPWSEPIWLQQQGIDPSLYFENGKCYMVSNPDNTIMLCQIDPKSGRQLTESIPLWQGTGGRYPEGPHLYKKDGFYYLLISEGGTELAHSLTIARSANIEGPYEPNPDNPLLTHCSLAGQNSQIQGTGHGDLVEAADGSWWMVFLAYRNYGGSYHHLGRETFLAPVVWPTGGWPVVNGGLPIDTLMQTSAALLPSKPLPRHRHVHTTFTHPLGPEWMYIQNPEHSRYQLIDGKLRLTASSTTLTENQQPTFVGRRQESATFTVETFVDFYESAPQDEAGLTVYQINDGHVDFCIHPDNRGSRLCLKLRLKNLDVTVKETPLPLTRCHLRVRSDGKMYYFDYSTDGQRYELFDQIDCTLLSTETAGGFTGVILGMYATMNPGNLGTGPSYAEFTYFDYTEE